MLITRGDGRIIHCTTHDDAVDALRQAQAEGDRYAAVHGVAPDVARDIERRAGYTIGASAAECYDALSGYAQPLPRVDNWCWMSQTSAIGRSVLTTVIITKKPQKSHSKKNFLML